MAEGRKRARIFCSHCSERVSKSTYYRHRSDEAASFLASSSAPARSRSAEDLAALDTQSSSDSEADQTFDVSDPDTRMDNECLSGLGGEYSRDSGSMVSSTSSSSSSEDGTESVCEQDANSEVWISTDSESDEAEPATEQNHGMSQHLRLIYTFLLFWQFAYKVSNNAMHCLLRFLKYIILLIGNAFQCHQISDSAQQFPVTLNSLYKQMLVENNHLFTEYVVCRKCHSVYEYDNCIIRQSNGRSESKRCCHVAYPRHPHRTQRQPCNEILLKRIRTGKGYKLIPFKVYPYYTLEKQFARLLKRKNFTTKCEMWRRRANFIHEDNLSDVYDGRVWKKFNSADGLNFLTSPYSYLLTLNVDWFQPFDRGVYSVGALYITVQNLPRSERFKSENVLLIGIIPGPKEPKHAINSYLAPLVLELQKAWESGFLMKTAQQVEVRVKLALSCVSCDIPASRKVVGFLGHNATLGCNKCYKNFYVRVGEESDFSGYDRDNWTLRDDKRHRSDVDTVREQVTKSGIKAKESELGVRYSVLLELEYFDPIEFTVIDVMHNLFLGSAKRVLEIWIEKGLIKKDNLVKIDGMIQSFNMPTDCGRLPSNLSSSHGAPHSGKIGLLPIHLLF